MQCLYCGAAVDTQNPVCPDCRQWRARLVKVRLCGVAAGIMGSLIGYTLGDVLGSILGGFLGIVAGELSARAVVRPAGAP